MSEHLDLPKDDVGDDLPLRELSISLVFAYRQTPVQVWRALTEEIGVWWTEKVHPEARTILPVQPGGQWVQLWSNGGALLGTVTHVHAPLLLRISGPLAMTAPVNNTVELRLELMDSGSTRLKLEHLALGILHGTDEESYTQVWNDLFDVALTRYLDRC
ncbi:MAG: hypothetical protein HYX32_14830 [Actinobacteria bacterium]|nr:hypothetical protein [Actinomycetota bacterium]